MILSPTRGDASRTRKLTSLDVRLIRACAAAGIRNKALWTAWPQVSRSQLSQIVRGKAWRDEP